jgi:Fip1 motif
MLGSKVYLRPQALTPSGPASFIDPSSVVAKVPIKDETKRLRFSHHRTAFDVDIENLESHPWRNKNVDLSDYFNYGFSEATWQVFFIIEWSH